MKLKTLFHKPIDRQIEGVIKADDQDSLQNEVDEYVLTNEIRTRLQKLLERYSDYRGANGVWISGFFGSGKSHLLKMLSMLLDDDDNARFGVAERFVGKAERSDDHFLASELDKAARIPSQSILFNIDQKANVLSKNATDALVAVFVKVFDEMNGYYGKQPYIAQFERELDGRGHLAAFKQRYAAIAGKPWELGREETFLEADNIAAAFADVTGSSAAAAHDILEKYRAGYRLSIEDFAELVDAYIQQQPADFRLNFFVDEVGQYIADNTKLMTNLQTVAESLATKSRGRAWVFVTAQEEMQSVLGDMTKQQGHDFSKIQARFANRVKLTSSNVAEVIEERLLAKTEAAQSILGELYDAQKNNFRTLFDFADGSQRYPTYKHRDHFIRSYPFVPYQFALFQDAIMALSRHNAFEGRHSSVGERSMLGVFQEVAKQIAAHEVGELATFDLMYEGIRNSLKAQVTHAITNAPTKVDDPFAVQVLKALFLVKYIKGFQATPRNLRVLLTSRFDEEIGELRQRIEGALAVLEGQTLVQRNGDVFEFLTNAEQDVEREIKNTEVEIPVLRETVRKLVFDEIVRSSKLTVDGGRTFAYTRIVDDQLFGRSYELAIRLISPLNDYFGADSTLIAQSLGRAELIVILPSDDRLLPELKLYEQTSRYHRLNYDSLTQERTRRILEAKSIQNGTRYGDLRERVRRLLGEAKLVINGEVLNIDTREPIGRIQTAFNHLVERTYTNLAMLGGRTFEQSQIPAYLRRDPTLIGSESALGEAERELLGYIEGNKRRGERTSLQRVTQQFERKPYGWPLAAVQCLLARLVALGKVDLFHDGSEITDNATLTRLIGSTRNSDSVTLEPQPEYTAREIGRLRDFYRDLFNQPAQSHDAKQLGRATGAAITRLRDDLQTLMRQHAYPFMSDLQPLIDGLGEVGGKSAEFYLRQLPQFEDRLLDQKEDTLDPLRDFLSSPQRAIYDDARDFLRTQTDNVREVDATTAAAMRQTLGQPRLYTSTALTQVKQQVDDLRQRVRAAVEQQRAHSRDALEQRWQQITTLPDFAALPSDQRENLRQPFDEAAQQMARLDSIPVIRDALRQFNENRFPAVLQRLANIAAGPSVSDEQADDAPPLLRETVHTIVPMRRVAPRFAKPYLENAEDIAAYLAALQAALTQAIDEGQKVQV